MRQGLDMGLEGLAVVILSVAGKKTIKGGGTTTILTDPWG